MGNFILVYLDWIMGALGIWGQYVTFVRKVWWAAHLGLTMQIGWVIYALNRQEYGLLPVSFGTCIILGVAVRNDYRVYYKKMKEENIVKNENLKETLFHFCRRTP